MTVLQLILLGTHILIGVLMYKTGFDDGKIEGGIQEAQRRMEKTIDQVNKAWR